MNSNKTEPGAGQIVCKVFDTGLEFNSQIHMQVCSWFSSLTVDIKAILLKTPNNVAAGHRRTYLKPTRKTPPCWPAILGLVRGCYEGYRERKYISGLTQCWTLHSVILTCQTRHVHRHSSGRNVKRVADN